MSVRILSRVVRCRQGKILVWFVVILGLLSATPSFGQTLALQDPINLKQAALERVSGQSAFGMYGDVAFVTHTADFRAIPGFPNCCPQFTNGTGHSPDFGLYYKRHLGSDFYFYLRAGYAGYGATLTDREFTTVLDQKGVPTQGAFDHTITASLGSLGLEPMIGFNLFETFMLRAGGRVGYVITKTFSQQEVIALPSDFGVFTDTRTRTRNQFDGQALPNASSIEAALMAGVSYEVPLNRSRTLVAVPEVYFSLGLTQITTALSWKANAVRAGIGIEYTPAAPPIDTAIPPPPFKKPMLAASVTAVGVTPEGTEYPHVTIKVEEFLSTRLRPLLNYVFFAESSSMIPDRYTRLTSEQTHHFRVETLYNYETLPTYYHLLNIVGRRLVENPKATIKLVGCNSDEHNERGNKELSRERAEHVRDYLRDVWEISNARMEVEVRNLPEKPSFPTDSDGMVENRRVEIQSEDWNIVQPVLTNDTVTRVTPGMLRFKPSVQTDAGLTSWMLDADRNAFPIKQFTGAGAVPATVEWKLDSNDQASPRSLLAHEGGGVAYSLDVKDNSGQEIRTIADSIPVEKVTIQKKRSERVADKEIDHYSLILFDFDKATLTSANQKISEYIREHSSEDATVRIAGYTDRMGDEKHNQRLAESRAQQTAKELNVKTALVTGLGKSVLLYDNDLPEGRFYCRTVNVDVERPITE